MAGLWRVYGEFMARFRLNAPIMAHFRIKNKKSAKYGA
jgi:hypothetical protein